MTSMDARRTEQRMLLVAELMSTPSGVVDIPAIAVLITRPARLSPFSQLTVATGMFPCLAAHGRHSSLSSLHLEGQDAYLGAQQDVSLCQHPS